LNEDGIWIALPFPNDNDPAGCNGYATPLTAAVFAIFNSTIYVNNVNVSKNNPKAIALILTSVPIVAKPKQTNARIMRIMSDDIFHFN
jgi:hypothetical protein